MFDIEDEHQLKLYEHLKKRSNGSSYIRTLLYLDLYGKVDQQTQPELNIEAEPVNIYPIVKEQVNEIDEDDIILDGIL